MFSHPVYTFIFCISMVSGSTYLVWANQDKYCKNAPQCSKRMQKWDVTTQLQKSIIFQRTFYEKYQKCKLIFLIRRIIKNVCLKDHAKATISSRQVLFSFKQLSVLLARFIMGEWFYIFKFKLVKFSLNTFTNNF